MHKRGQVEALETSQIFEILAAIAIAAFLILAALSWNSISNFGKVYLEEDLKLATNAVLSAPSPVKLSYPVSSNYKIELKDKVHILHNPGVGGEASTLVMESSPAAEQLSVKRLG